MLIDKVSKFLGIALTVVGVLFVLAIAFAPVYIAAHFVEKFW